MVFLALVELACIQILFSQSDTLDQVPLALEDQIESFLGNLDDEVDFDFNTISEYLLELHLNPINLNTVTLPELENLRLLSDIQIAEFFSYRRRLGNLLSIYELQAIPSFDRKTIASIRPFISLQSTPTQSVLKSKSFGKGKNELFLRWSRDLEKQRGYQARNGNPPAFEGSPDKLYLRFRHRFENKLSYGFTLEKDAGESFFRASNPQGFDYASAHFFLRDHNKTIKAVALGDYSISLGQGLVLHSGFGRGKSSFVSQIKKGGRTIRPYSSVNESSFLRGAATTLALDNWQVTLFGSLNKVDGNIRVDSLDRNDVFSLFTSLQQSGLHRTNSEIEDENVVGHRIIGGQISYRDRQRLTLGLNFLNNHFDQIFRRRLQPYNQFYFQGSDLSNASIEYTYLLRNFHFFGETAISDNGALASINGLLIGLGQQLDLSILYRDISRRYQALQANPFLESSQAINERGLYLGAELKFSEAAWLSLYADHWQHPWLRFNVDAPSTGREYLARFTYYEKRKIDTYIQYRYEEKATNNRTNPFIIPPLYHGKRQNLRLHFNNKLNAHIELRNRLELSWVKGPQDGINKGFLIYQDIIFRSLTSPLSFTARVAYFDADNYAARIYAYENDILYSFSIPAYYNEGIRYYTNLRYRLNKTITAEVRWEQTRFRDVSEIGSGNSQILGNKRSRLKLQCRISF